MMPAAVESMAYFGEVPWHGLGTRLTEAETLDCKLGLEKAGLDWEVGLKPVYDIVDDIPVISPMAKFTYRKSDNKTLGVVGPRYTPYQNMYFLDFLQPFVDAGEVTLHTAGSLDGGKRVWVLAEICREANEIVKGDKVSKFILGSNSHDGGPSIRIGYTDVRTVCANTLAAAHNSASSKLMRIRHTSKAQANVEALRETMDAVNSEFNATAEKYRWLASRQINKADLKKYIKIVLGFESKSDDELPTRSKNTIESIIKLVETGRGADIPGVQGTWWGAYNGVTEYLSYNAGRNENNRMSSLWFGQNGAVNAKAFDTALALAV